MSLTVSNAIKLIENALKEARQGAFRVRSCRGFEKMRMPSRRRGAPPEKLWAVIARKRTSQRGDFQRFGDVEKSDLVGAASGFALKAQ